jgi:hypothetical protein
MPTCQDRCVIVDTPFETVYATVHPNNRKDIHWLDTRAPLSITVLLYIYFEVPVVLPSIQQRAV